MHLGLALSLSGSTSGGAAATGGTSATRYSFAGTRMRWSILTRTFDASTNNYQIARTFIGSPGYDITNPRFYAPAFDTASNGTETVLTNDITIEGASIKIGGTWYACAGGTITAGQNGLLLPAITGVTIPANTLFEFRWTYVFPKLAAQKIPVQVKNVTILSDYSQGAATTYSAKLTDDSTLSASNGTNAPSDIYLPSFMVAQGGDGRPAFLGTGDSIMHAVTPIQAWDARGNFGGLCFGIDDNSTSKRCAVFNSAIPGNSPSAWKTRTNIARKLNAIKEVYDLYGEWPFDWVLDQHGHNATAGTAVADTLAWLQLAKTEWGKPICKIEIFPDPDSTDGYQTLGAESTPANWDYATGAYWAINKATSAAGTSDPTSTWRVGTYIDDSFAPWLNSSYDTTTNRDKHKLSGITTTITPALSAGNLPSSMAVADASLISVGDNFMVPNGVSGDNSSTGPAWGTVTAKAGNTLTVTNGRAVPTGGMAAGATLSVTHFDGTGTHPSATSHVAFYKPAVITWKLALEARGWR